MKKVLLIYSQLLLSASVANVLARELDMDVAGTSFIDKKILFQTINRFLPDVVIIDESIMQDDASLIPDLLGEYNRLQIIVVSIAENNVVVYEKREVQIRKSKDLANTVRGSLMVC